MPVLEIHDIAGSVGVTLVVGSYLFLQLGKLRSDDLSYSIVNGLGAGLILVSLSFAPNLSAVLVEVFWLAISIIGVARYVIRRRAARVPPSTGSG